MHCLVKDLFVKKRKNEQNITARFVFLFSIKIHKNHFQIALYFHTKAIDYTSLNYHCGF